MTTDSDRALLLRCALAAIYLRGDPPPGEARARGLIAALRRTPNHAVATMASDLLDAVALYRGLSAALAVAERADVAEAPAEDPASPDPAGAESPRAEPRPSARETIPALRALIAQATDALCTSTEHPGWRAAALDLLEPDGHADLPLDRVTSLHLFALSRGLLGPRADEPGE